jgi:hypothetical protein
MGMARPSPTIKKSGPTDVLNLTSVQQRAAWKDLSKGTQQRNPSGFLATLGSIVPPTIKIQRIPGSTATNIPALRPYDFALAPGNLLIVNPSTGKSPR